MGIPTLLSSVYQDTTLRVIFSEAITAPGGDELDGFTFVLDGVPETPVLVGFDANALVVTLGGPVVDTLTVAYVSGSGAIVSVSTAEAAVTFAETPAVEYPSIAVVMRADCGQPANDVVRVYFSEPVASTADDLIDGFTISVNGTDLVLVGATATLDDTLTTLSIATGTDFAYSDEVDVAYVQADGSLYSYASGNVANFEFLAIDNLSTVGLPDSQYPLSWVTSYTPVIEDKAVIATIGLTLNPIDIKLVAQYGPAILITGGTFGETEENPDGVEILGKRVTLIDGIQFFERFAVPGMAPSWLVAAANDWQTVMTNKIGQILGQYRAIDQTLTLHGQTVAAV